MEIEGEQEGEGEEGGGRGVRRSRRGGRRTYTEQLAHTGTTQPPLRLPLTQVESLQPFTRESFPRKERSPIARKQMVFYSVWRGQITADSSRSHARLISTLT